MLHNKVLSVLKHERPVRAQNGPRRTLECRRTPIHIVATSNPRLPSIELGRRVLPLEHLKESKNREPQSASGLTRSPSSPPLDSTSTSATDQPVCSNSRKRKQLHPEPSDEIADEDYEVPRVIISLALERHQTLSSDSCQKWLASCPTLVKYARVEAVYKGFSALVFLSIPVFIWDFLPEDPACSFVGYVTSRNLINYCPQTLGSGKGSIAVNSPVSSDLNNFVIQKQPRLAVDNEYIEMVDTKSTRKPISPVDSSHLSLADQMAVERITALTKKLLSRLYEADPEHTHHPLLPEPMQPQAMGPRQEDTGREKIDDGLFQLNGQWTSNASSGIILEGNSVAVASNPWTEETLMTHIQSPKRLLCKSNNPIIHRIRSNSSKTP